MPRRQRPPTCPRGHRGSPTSEPVRAENDEGPFEPDADVAESPRRAADRRLVPHSGERGERGQHLVDGVDWSATFGERLEPRGDVGQHTGRATRKELADRRRFVRRTSAAARRAAGWPRRSTRRARAPAHAGVHRFRLRRRCRQQPCSAAAARDDHRPPSIVTSSGS